MDLSQKEWHEKWSEDSNAIVLDVRKKEELDAGFIPKAKNFDFYGGETFINQLESLDKTKNYYVYCRSGQRSAKACEIMSQLNFKNIFNLEDGFINWKGEVSNFLD